MLHQIASDMNKSKRQSFSNVAITTWNDDGCLAGDKLQQDIHHWLSPPDPWKNHNVARELHHTGTAIWFVKGNTFLEWKSSQSSSVLWIHGKREYSPSASGLAEILSLPLFVAGAGKSVLWYVDLPVFRFDDLWC